MPIRAPRTKGSLSVLGLYPPRQTPRQPSSVTLYKEIGRWVTAVKGVAETLPEPGDSAATKELFAVHRDGLTELPTLLIDYTQQQHHPYHSMIHRSKGALTAAPVAIDKARQCAKLFGGYSRKPKTYDKVDAAAELRYLLAALTNMWKWLKPPTP